MTIKDLPFEKTKKIFNSDGNNYTDEEIKEMQIFLTNLTRIYYDWYMRENQKGTWQGIRKMKDKKYKT
jgi:hypothetical protein